MFYKRAVSDGTNMFINHKNLPNACKIQTRPNDPISREQIKENPQVPRERRHIVLGLVMNKTVLFYIHDKNMGKACTILHNLST